MRTRLVLSYTLVILVCLGVVSLTMFVLLLRTSLPDRQIYAELTALSRLILVRPLADELLREQPADRLDLLLDRLADAQSLRIMLARADGRVIADSQESLVGHDLFQEGNLASERGELVQGSLRLPGTLQRWLFVGRLAPTAPGDESRWLIVARQAPRLPIFQIFGEESARPAGSGGFSELGPVGPARLVDQPLDRPAGAAGSLGGPCHCQRRL